MGDKNAPGEFGAVFQGAICTRQASVTKKMVELLGAVCTRTASAHVGSHSSKTMFLKRVCWFWAQRTNVNIRQGECSALEICGLRLNAGKLVILPNLRRMVENRKFSRRKQEYHIKASHRFLGIVYPAMLSMGAEIDQRIWATKSAWRELYGMWWNKRAPYHFSFMTETTFDCRDAWRKSSVLSCSAPDHIRTLSSRQVWKRWRLAPPAYELCVQRLRWHCQRARTSCTSSAVGLAECTSNRTTHSLRAFVCILRQMVMRSSLADLQTLAFVPEWAEQVANVEMSKLNEWFLSLDLRQFRAAFFTQTVAPCRVELSDDEGDDDLEGKTENYICTLLDEDGWECGQRWPTARALAAHQLHTHGGTHGEPKGVASLVVTNQCFWCGSTHASIETTSKPMAAAERHNRCKVDAGRFPYPVVDIPPDTICPRCDLIFYDTAELQRHLASMEFRLLRVIH